MSVFPISNAQIKHVRFLHQKKYRQKYNQFIVEGFKSVNEFLASELQCESIFIHHDAVLPINGAEVYTCSEKQMQQITALKNHQQVLAVFTIPQMRTLPAATFYLCLDDIRDPGNLGTIIRTADWFGLQEIVCSPSCAEAFNPKVVQASMGSLSRMQVRYENLVGFINEHKKYALLLADMEGISYKKTRYIDTILVIGNEGKGVSEEIRELQHQKVSIPQIGKAESLNAALSAAILLSEALTQ